jgi:hypothetical protein
MPSNRNKLVNFVVRRRAAVGAWKAEGGFIMRTRMALALALLLGGCATQAERAAQQQREVDEMIAVYGPACERLGNARDSQQWRSCILTLDTRNALRYRTAPTTTTCFGHRGFFNCSTF